MAPIPRRVLSDKSLMVEVSAADAARIKSFMPAYTAVSVNVLLAFGLRIGELCALRVDDFDFDRMVVHIRHSIRRGPDDTGELRLAELKTVGSMDALPIPPQLVPVLREHIDRFTDAPRPGAMLLRPAKSRVMSDRTLRTQLEKAAVKAGRPDVTPHAFRALRVDDFDFDRMVVHIRHSIRRGPDDTGELRLAELKTVGSMDALPIPPQLVPVLREHIDRFTDAPRPGAMLLRPAKSRVMSDRTLRTQLEKAAVKAGRPDVTPHAFRATAHPTIK